MSPATAELNYLDKVKWHDMYGVDLHPVLGEDSVEYFLGLTLSGIVVLRNKTTVAHYYWPRIAKVYYKGRYFMLRISDKNNELSTYGFETPRKTACKHLWRCCLEHHAFFRMVRIAPLPNSQSNNSDLFQLGSRLRYSYAKRRFRERFVGPDFGLKVVLNTSHKDEFMSILNIDGYIVIVHDSDTYPDPSSVESQELYLSSGEGSSVLLRAFLISTEPSLRSFSSQTVSTNFMLSNIFILALFLFFVFPSLA
ncbi:band 4.1-like protein 4 isoform X2 [Eurosta solidaginis]|uniref:band 4.1-like protein 4 isoform X2 n=1 Tax=Eurosta solidaginis TaxID=178769 RepID=UPI00353122BD